MILRKEYIRTTLLVSAGLFVAGICSFFASQSGIPTAIGLLATGLAVAVTTMNVRLAPAQPALIMAAFGLLWTFSPAHPGAFSFSFLPIAVSLLVQYGQLRKRPRGKIIGVYTYFIATVIVGDLLHEHADLLLSDSATVVMAITLVQLVATIFRDRLNPLFRLATRPPLNLHMFGITKAEYRSIEMVILAGLPVKEAAPLMQLSISTVNGHLSSVYRKLDIPHSQLALARFLEPFLPFWADQ